MTLNVLIIDDDQDFLENIREFLYDSIPTYKDCSFNYQLCNSFESGIAFLKSQHYSIVICDVYSGTQQPANSTDAEQTYKAIRKTRFCPLVFVSAGTAPHFLPKHETPFTRFVSKAEPRELPRIISEIMDSGIPQIAYHIHNIVDGSLSFHLWNFLDSHWARLQTTGYIDYANMTRIVERRVISALNEDINSASPQPKARPWDYYRLPVSQNEPLSLGALLLDEEASRHFVLLTPHCDLVSHNGSPPKADHVLLTEAFTCESLFDTREENNPVLKTPRIGDEDKYYRIPCDFGRPNGRYCYLPAFLDIPHLYCDLLRTFTMPYSQAMSIMKILAVIQSPFAESIQSSFCRLFSRIGLPDLDRDTGFSFQELKLKA